jgi:pSer/pThr/pTyr-binding forkhead associated (FHA) protein
MGFRLTVTRGKSEGKEFSFTKARVRVGRNHDNDLVLYDLNVSRHHFEIVLEGSHYLLKDCGSQNGTRVNDAPAVDAPLRDGDRIQLGGLEFEFAGSDTQPHFQLESTERAELFAPVSPEQRTKLEEIRTSAVSLKQLQALKEHGELGPSGGSMHKKKKKKPAEAANDEGDKEERLAARDSSTDVKRRPIDPGLNRRRVLYPLTALLVCAVIMTVFLKLYPTKPPNLSAQKFAFGPELAGKSFGAGRVDVPTPEKAQFTWISSGGRAVLHFSAGGIEREDEVAIALNGEPIVNVPVTGQAWGGEIELKLDRKRLLPAQENVLAFVHRPQPGEAPRWGVRDVSLTETALPPPSLERALLALRLADEAVQNKKIAPGNLASAEENYRQAILSMEALEPAPEQYARAEAALKSVQAELKAILDSKLFLAANAKKLGQSAEAEGILRELLLYFPREGDQRRQLVTERLAAAGTPK